MDDHPLRQAWDRPAAPLPIVIFGAGSIVRDAHLPAYLRAGYQIAGIYDPDRGKARALAAEHGVMAFPDIETALSAADGRVVYDLATPPSTHRDILARLPRGAAALIQKPLGADLAAATDIVAICRERELAAAVNFQLRFAPMMLALRDAIDRNWLGEIVDIEMHAVLATPWGLWRFLDGLPRIEITMHSIHYLDLIRSILGEPAGVFARSIGHPAHAMAQTRTAAVLDYGDRVRCVLSINHDWDFGRPHQVCEMRVAGTEGAAWMQLGVNLDYPKGEPDRLRLCRHGGAWQEVPLQGAWFIEAFEGRMHSLQRAAAGAEPMAASFEDGWKTMALVEALYDSTANPGTPVESLP